MLDPSTYDTTHRYYEQKRAEVLDGVSSGDSGHPRGPRRGHSAPGTDCSARAHWPHARTWRQPIKVSLPYTSTRRPSQAIQGIKWDPRPSPRLTPWRKLNPGSKTSGGAESTLQQRVDRGSTHCARRPRLRPRRTPRAPARPAQGRPKRSPQERGRTPERRAPGTVCGSSPTKPQGSPSTALPGRRREEGPRPQTPARHSLRRGSH